MMFTTGARFGRPHLVLVIRYASMEGSGWRVLGEVIDAPIPGRCLVILLAWDRIGITTPGTSTAPG